MLTNQKNGKEPRGSLFEQFCNRMFLSRNKDAPVSVSEFVYQQNYMTMRFVAIVVILVDLFWLLTDFRRGGALRMDTRLALIGIILQVTTSVAMLVLANVKRKKPEFLMRLSFLIYHTCMIGGIIALKINKNISIVEANAVSRYLGVSLSSYFLFIITMQPMPRLGDELLIAAETVLAFFLPCLAKGVEAYSILQNLVLHGCVLVAMFVFRKLYMEMGEAQGNLRRLNRKLEIASYQDGLTDALNRNALEVYGKYLQNSGEIRNVGVIMMDIDDFKKYNDNFSHLKGDEVLHDMVASVVRAFEEEGHFLFRYGGEEFVLFLENPEEGEILEHAKRLQETVCRENRKHGVTITVGCALENAVADSDLILNADRELYYGKEHGKNCISINHTIYPMAESEERK